MDLMDFGQATLYFDDPAGSEVEALIAEAGGCYGEQAAETLLYRAHFLAPQSLLVLVALYRYFFYQHRLPEGLLVAERALAVAGRRLEFPADWRALHPSYLGHGAMRSMGMLRFYLNVLKASAYLHLRLGRMEEGRARLLKLIEMDSHDRLGGKALLDLVETKDAEAEAA